VSVTISYILNSAIWSLVGIVVGYSLGRLGNSVSDIRNDVNDIREKVIVEPTLAEPAAVPVSRRHRRSYWWSLHSDDSQHVLSFIVAVMALVTVILVLYQKIQLDRTTACYVQYAHEFTNAFAARDQDSQRARDAAIANNVALGNLVKEVITNAPANGGQPSPEQRATGLAALTGYFTANQTYTKSLQAAQQSAHNFPVPTNHC
jgi:hypothetical protein